MAEALIRQRVADHAKAVGAKDIDRVMSLYAPNIVSFDVNPPLRYSGTDCKHRAWRDFFATYTGPVAYEVGDLNVGTDGELAFSQQPQPREGHDGWRSHHRPVDALDSVLPTN